MHCCDQVELLEVPERGEAQKVNTVSGFRPSKSEGRLRMKLLTSAAGSTEWGFRVDVFRLYFGRNDSM